jgi:hypothetical protein
MSSKRQDILDWLVNDSGPLKLITTGGGYANTVNLVQRGQRDLNDIPDSLYPCLFIAGTSEVRQNITVNQFNSELTVEIVGAVKSATGVSGAQAQLDTLIADVTEALETDRKQGNRVYTTMVKRIDTDPGDMEFNAAFLIQVIFKYATEGTNP